MFCLLCDFQILKQSLIRVTTAKIATTQVAETEFLDLFWYSFVIIPWVEIQEGKYPCPYFRRSCIKADIQKQSTVDSCHVAFWRKKSQENSSQTFILCPPRLFCLFSVCTIGKICCIITMNCLTQSQLGEIIFEVESLLLQFRYSKKAQNF